MENVKPYLELFHRLRRRKRWGTDTTVLRFVALSLASTDLADPAARLEAVADELRQGAGWSSPLRSSIRYMIAALILKRGLPAGRVMRSVETVREGFRERRMKRGGTHEILAALLLALHAGGGRVTARNIDRVRDILADWKRDHPWLTGADDYAMAALHATREESVPEIASGVEEIYQALRREGLRRGNALQLTSHLLAIGPMPARQAARRFGFLAAALEERKWRVSTSRYDEVAILTLCTSGPKRLAEQVLRIQERLRAEKPRPTKDVAFSLAAGLTLAAGAERGLTDARDIATARMAQAIMEAQQAAMIAAVTASTAATTAATAGG